MIIMLRAYRQDMERANRRIAAVMSHKIETRFGTMEYAEQGTGVPLLVSHGVLGCHVDGVDGWFARLPGPGFRVVAPSRFGYFGSTLPEDATPADQADAYALLLDRLGVDRAVVIGFSAGSASVLEFAGRHADRVLGLILASARLGGGVTARNLLKPLFRAAYSAQPLFWLFKQIAPAGYAHMMGAPKGFRPTPVEAAALDGIRELLFPLTPRRDGAIFDGFVSNPVADRFPFEELAVPALVVAAVDDPLAPYAFAAKAAERIPGARLVTVERGGHLYLGSDSQVREEIRAFATSVAGSPSGVGEVDL